MSYQIDLHDCIILTYNLMDSLERLEDTIYWIAGIKVEWLIALIVTWYFWY